MRTTKKEIDIMLKDISDIFEVKLDIVKFMPGYPDKPSYSIETENSRHISPGGLKYFELCKVLHTLHNYVFEVRWNQIRKEKGE